MKNFKLHGFTLLFAAVVAVLTFSGFAAAASNSAYAKSNDVALEALSNKIKADTGVRDISLKFDKVNQYNVSKSTLGVKGSAKYFIDSEYVTPLTFDVKMNTTDWSVVNVNYDFEDADETFAVGSPIEENITQKLLKQIGSQFKTSNITISIDNLETQKNQLKGTGEVRIGDFEWRRIEFDAALNKNAVTAVKYKLEQ